MTAVHDEFYGQSLSLQCSVPECIQTYLLSHLALLSIPPHKFCELVFGRSLSLSIVVFCSMPAGDMQSRCTSPAEVVLTMALWKTSGTLTAHRKLFWTE